VRLWDCENKACVGIGIGHMGAVGAVALSKKQQNFFVSGSSDRTLKVWNMDGVTGNNEEIITLKAKAVVAAHDKDINSLAVAPNDSLVCSDSDGFIKLWTVRNEECIATFDQHDDKEEGVLRVQELKNALIDADYTRAIQIAFELRRPHGLLDIFTELHRKRDAGDQIVKAVDALSKEELRLHLEYIREWNTKTVLSYSNFFLSCTPITKMIEIKGNEGVLEGLIAYTQRHFNRLVGLERENHMLGYTSYRM
uniref:WD40-repeat protein n=1 Tax=Solanum tuberosum TaxID=4113 RepID=M1B0C4_SOLTU